MRALIPALAALFTAGAAYGQAPQGEAPTTIICLEGGRTVPPACRAPASRLDPREDICQCAAGGQQTVVAVCPKGVEPPPEGVALNRARREQVKNGSLVGATFQGRPICVAPRATGPY